MKRLLPVLALAAWAAPPPARACTQAVCTEGVLGPHDGATIPANQPVLALRAAAPAGANPIEPGVNVRLEGPGGPVPIAVAKLRNTSYWLLTPDRLTAGTSYTLTYDYECGRGPTTRKSTFTVGTAAPAPSTAGTLKFIDSQVVPGMEPPAGTSCSIDYDHAITSYAFIASAELLPYISITRLTAQVDGMFWDEKEFGALPLDAGITLSANCEPDKQPALLELKPGKHLLEVEVEVAGGPTLTLPPQEVMLSCQAKPAPGHGDAGANSTTTGGDCSFGRGAPGAPAALLPLLALLLLRRRGRP
ncbi:MAG TPA: hypothetical protein VN914_21970 [Polyangia bacterium]|nr:hypothetical protein [Polyangia bacterium]